VIVVRNVGERAVVVFVGAVQLPRTILPHEVVALTGRVTVPAEVEIVARTSGALTVRAREA
jgi:hypothetical protein